MNIHNLHKDIMREAKLYTIASDECLCYRRDYGLTIERAGREPVGCCRLFCGPSDWFASEDWQAVRHELAVYLGMEDR
jgi:hypothetical protein